MIHLRKNTAWFCDLQGHGDLYKNFENWCYVGFNALLCTFDAAFESNQNKQKQRLNAAQFFI